MSDFAGFVYDHGAPRTVRITISNGSAMGRDRDVAAAVVRELCGCPKHPVGPFIQEIVVRRNEVVVALYIPKGIDEATYLDDARKSLHERVLAASGIPAAVT